jgi:8-amino-7-oxononanoate synthase
MDIFEKCRRYTEPKKAKEAGYYPYFHCVQSGQDPEVIIEGRKMIMIGSNNYLGLTSHPKLKEAAIKATEKYGVGCVGSRFLNGTLDIHEELEARLARFVRKEAALVFTTGMQTNLGTISALVGRGDYVITDRLDHASIIDGCRLSYGQMKRFRHNDIEDLENTLSKIPREAGKLIVVDGVFSMEGDIAPLKEIIPVAKRYNAKLMVDDAHGIGVLGEGGRGTCEHLVVEDEVDIIMGTFSKSFAGIGGFIAADEAVVNYVKHFARSMIFSASLSPGCTASVLAALDIIEGEPERRKSLLEKARRVREGLTELGFDTGLSVTPIIPVMVGPLLKTLYMWKGLFEKGIFTTPVIPPAVPEGTCRIRASIMATLEDKHIELILRAFEEVGRELKII